MGLDKVLEVGEVNWRWWSFVLVMAERCFLVGEGALLCGDIHERFHAVCLCYRVFAYLLFDIIHDVTVVFLTIVGGCCGLFPVFLCLCSVIYVMCRVCLFYEGNILHRAVAKNGCQNLTRWARYLYVTFGGCCARGGDAIMVWVLCTVYCQSLTFIGVSVRSS